MTTSLDRIIQFSIGRIAANADDIDTGVLSDEIFGQVSGVTGGQVVPQFNDGYGPSGRDRYWNGRFNIEDLEFTLLKASERPEQLMAQVIYMELNESWRNAAGTLVTRRSRYSGMLRDDGAKALDLTTDSPRSLAIVVHQKIVGGGDAYQTMTKTGSDEYADTRTGEWYVAGTDQYAGIRTAHGV